jgi:hypothetical protein
MLAFVQQAMWGLLSLSGERSAFPGPTCIPQLNYQTGHEPAREMRLLSGIGCSTFLKEQKDSALPCMMHYHMFKLENNTSYLTRDCSFLKESVQYIIAHSKIVISFSHKLCN